jgi:Fur family transcriptional regulator, ferric uptake regulator
MADLHAVAAARLRGDDQRYTANRRAIVEALAASKRPLSIPQLLALDDELAQSSVYRNLAVLERAGVVHRIVTDDEFARYELAEDLTGHHHHIICSRCGAVDDFTLPAQLETEIERVLKRVASRSRFQARTHRLDLVGVCELCA